MAFIEEMDIEETSAEAVAPSQVRLLDAEEIEKAAAGMTRPTARMHLEALAKKLRKEGEALKRVEESQHKSKHSESTSPEKEKEVETAPASTAPPAPAPTPKPPVQPTDNTKMDIEERPSMGSAKYVSIDKFSFDFGGYNSEFVTLYVDLPDVGSIPKDQITCTFTASTFDLIVRDLNGKSYRLFKEHLEKDIVPEKSKKVVKRNKVVLKLAKKKGEYGSFDHWSKLTDKKGREKKNKDPSASIMDLMKDMYDNGDDSIRKVIGETMMKQRNGQLDPDMGLDKDKL